MLHDSSLSASVANPPSASASTATTCILPSLSMRSPKSLAAGICKKSTPNMTTTTMKMTVTTKHPATKHGVRLFALLILPPNRTRRHAYTYKYYITASSGMSIVKRHIRQPPRSAYKRFNPRSRKATDETSPISRRSLGAKKFAKHFLRTC